MSENLVYICVVSHSWILTNLPQQGSGLNINYPLNIMCLFTLTVQVEDGNEEHFSLCV